MVEPELEGPLKNPSGQCFFSPKVKYLNQSKQTFIYLKVNTFSGILMTH